MNKTFIERDDISYVYLDSDQNSSDNGDFALFVVVSYSWFNIFLLQDGSSRALHLDYTVWTILIQKSMVFSLVVAMWEGFPCISCRPILEFLDIASDIMKLLAIFQENES